MPSWGPSYAKDEGVIKRRIAKLEARFRIDPQDTLVTPADVQGWRDMGIVVPDCRPGGESMKAWLEQDSASTRVA